MDQTILVTGGTGVLGRAVVQRLRDDGHAVRIMSRRESPEFATADLRTGRGVAEALAGVDVVVHCATTQTRELRLVRTLLDAAGSRHLVYVSIVGVDRVPFPYYRAKLAAEQVIEQSGTPYTIVRATQFHDLIRTMLAWSAKLPVMPVPAIPVQPVDVHEVAERLAELALKEPAGRVPDFAGPDVRDCPELARAYLAATGRRRAIAPVRLPGKVFRAYRAGGHTAPENAEGTTTFEQYLAAHPAPRSVSYRGD